MRHAQHRFHVLDVVGYVGGVERAGRAEWSNFDERDELQQFSAAPAVASGAVVLGWLPDLKRWAEVAARFVRPGGILYVADAHPILQVWDDGEDVRPGELKLRYSYWEQPQPIATPVQGSYADRSADVGQPVEFSWQHSLGEIVTAVAQAGLRIEFLHEFPFVVWPVPFLEEQPDRTWRLPGELSGRLPLFFSLRARKPGEV